MNNHAGPVAIDDDTRRMVIELCKAAHEHVAVWTYPYGKPVLALAKQIRERMEAGEVEQARKPLTDVEMRQCANAMDAEPLSEGWKELIKFARAIERAHGITND